MSSHRSDILALIVAVGVVIVMAVVVKPILSGDNILPSATDKPVQTTGVPAEQTQAVVSDMTKVEIKNYSSYVIPKSEQKAIIGRYVGAAMDYYQPATREYAARYISGKISGEFNIGQACDLWDKARGDWNFESDGKELLDISSASSLINHGLRGDTADFSVFLASLIKAIGGQARVKTDQTINAGSITYPEIYLGNSADMATTVIDPAKLSALKSTYSYAFTNDPYGRNIFRFESGEICSGDNCWFYVRPFEQILREPEIYADICYQYPELIDYLLMYPETNVVEFQVMYIRYRYGNYHPYSGTTSPLRSVAYSYEFENNGDKTYWMRLGYYDRFPGDSKGTESGYATAFYSDGSYKDLKFTMCTV